MGVLETLGVIFLLIISAGVSFNFIWMNLTIKEIQEDITKIRDEQHRLYCTQVRTSTNIIELENKLDKKKGWK